MSRLALLKQELKFALYKIKNPNFIDDFQVVNKLVSGNDNFKVMIDIGAHHGHSLMNYAVDGWKIFAFEPDANNRKILTKFTDNYSNVVVEPYAVSNEEKDNVSFYSSNVSSGISSLLNFHKTHEEHNKISIITLKNYVNKNKIENISVIKIDTEGYDLFVLQGMEWGKNHPRVIYTEFDNLKSNLLGYNFIDQAKFLEQNNYRVLVSEWYPIEEYGKEHKWKRFTTNLNEVDNRAWGNFIAVKESDWSDLLKIAKIN